MGTVGSLGLPESHEVQAGLGEAPGFERAPWGSGVPGTGTTVLTCGQAGVSGPGTVWAGAEQGPCAHSLEAGAWGGGPLRGHRQRQAGRPAGALQAEEREVSPRLADG